LEIEEINYLYVNRDGVYEFEHFRPGMAARPSAYADNPVEQPVKMAEEGVIDLMDFDMDPDEEEKIRRSLEEKTKYKEVAPTWELNIEKYGTYRSVGVLDTA
jgi:malate/lactate dehydrogenase